MLKSISADVQRFMRLITASKLWDQPRAAGKPELATITLQASRTGDRLVVEAIDDGRGIDLAVVRRKAAERGLLSTEELAALSDEQAIELIFSAGFVYP